MKKKHPFTNFNIGIIGVLAIIFIPFVFVLSINDSKPAYALIDIDDNDPPKKTTTQEIPCPSGFEDNQCSGVGDGEDDNYINIAIGEALLECDYALTGCTADEFAEKESNRKLCEQSPDGKPTGCILTSSLREGSAGYQSCQATKVTCNDAAPFACFATDYYDISNYKCERPEKKTDPV